MTPLLLTDRPIALVVDPIEDATRREFITGVGAAALAAAFLAACGADDTDTAVGATGQFPVTIDHVYGSTTITAQPERVVALGGGEQDYLLALGVQPVGLARSFGDQPYAVWPWAIDRLTSEPEVRQRSSEPDIEWVASLNPDLILFHSPVMTQEAYAQLSAVAPTVGPPSAYSRPVWQETTERIGLAVGQSEESAAAIRAVEETYATKRAEYPDLQGVSVAYLTAYLGEDAIDIRSTAEPRVQVLTNLGMTVPPEVQTLAEAETVSFEQMNVLEAADLLFVTCDNPDDVQGLMDMPVFQALKFAKNGNYVFVQDATLLAAITGGSVLAIPYALDKIPPLLQEGIAGGRVVF